MSFWKKQKDREVPAPSGRDEDSDSGELDRAIDTFARVLRAKAKHAFPIGDQDAGRIASSYERWARHVLVLAPAPGSETFSQREWKKLEQFVSQHHAEEQSYVVESSRTMREAVFALVDCFFRGSREQTTVDDKLLGRVDRLRKMTERGSFEELRREALAAAMEMREALEENAARSAAHAKTLREHLMKLRDELDRARREGETDALTGLFNRGAFDKSLARELAVSDLLQRPLSMVLVDLDRFKSINDKHGHLVGDAVLRAAADTLTRSFPRRTDYIARYGGEEFVVLLPDTSATDAGMLAQRLLANFRQLRITAGSAQIAVTASSGVGEIGIGESSTDFIRRIDRALYAAKAAGRDRVRLAAARGSGTYRLSSEETAAVADISGRPTVKPERMM